MRRRIILLGLIASATIGVVVAQESGRDREAVLAADKAWANAIAKGDVPVLQQLFADDFSMISPDGRLKNKAQEIANLQPAPGTETFYFRTEDVTVRVYGDAAVVIGRAIWKVRYKGKDYDNDRRYTTTYVKLGGRWRAVAQQIAVNIPGFVSSSPK